MEESGSEGLDDLLNARKAGDDNKTIVYKRSTDLNLIHEIQFDLKSY